MPCGMRSILSGLTPCTSRKSAAPWSLMTTRRSESGSELVHHAALQRIGLGEDGVQRRDDRHPELAQELKDVAPGLSAEDSVLVLDRDDVDRVDVQEVRGAAVRRELALGDLEPNARRVCVAPTGSFIARTKHSISG